MPIITCPHCGARRNTPQEKLPLRPTEARCPQCSQSFNFDPAPYRQITTTEKPPLQQRITCPHCGLPREIPNNRRADKRASVNCRRCRRAFRLKHGETTPPAANVATVRQLTGVGKLLTDSWESFCQRGWGVLCIYLFISLLILTPLLFVALFLPQMTMDNRLLAWSAVAIGTGYAILGSGWMTASLFAHICNQDFGVFDSLRQGCRQLWKFTGFALLLGLIVAGGSLLLIVPGIIFSVWFCFSLFILTEEGGGGLQALGKSRQLVRGHWWQVFTRTLLLLLGTLTIAALTARLPVIGASFNFSFTLLLVPFCLFYYFQLYRDLQRCQQQATPPKPTTQWLPLSTALLGWMLIPALLFFINNQPFLSPAALTKQSSEIISGILGSDPTHLLNQAEQPLPQLRLPPPEPLTLTDYDRLLSTQQRETPRQGVNIGPATLSAEHFWNDDLEPHLWLKLHLTDLPNLALSHRRSTRILIDNVLDGEAQNRYDNQHSFENSAFHWIDIIPEQALSDGYGGIRNVYLKQGTRPEQISSISGQLVLNLPLGIKTLHLNRGDIGKTLQIAGKSLTLKTLSDGGIALNFQGRLSELLSIRAVNQQDEPLREAGATWQQEGNAINFKQMFSGSIETVTILVASDSVTRSYPFEITR